jgi:hypothetical protein
MKVIPLKNLEEIKISFFMHRNKFLRSNFRKNYRKMWATNLSPRKLHLQNFQPKQNFGYDRNIHTEFSIVLSGEPDIVFINQSQRKFVEFLCYIAGIILMWFGFSVLLFYDFIKQTMIYIFKIDLGIFKIFGTRSPTQPRAFKPPNQQIRCQVIAVDLIEDFIE